MMSKKPIAAPEDRAVRVFVSSTFRDMHGERDELIKKTFPHLRKLCEERGVAWGEVDLRWGITEEQSQRGEVLPICLGEIHRCRPYFIGLLGERYGWVPDEIPHELIEQEPWLQEYLHRSVTELEILHGVLNDPQMANHSLFYFRDPAFIDSLPASVQSEYLELPTSEEIGIHGREEAGRRAQDRRDKLAALKTRIKKSGLPVRENYPTPQALGEMVAYDLAQIIDRLYPKGSEPGPLDREAMDHEAFARSRARVYIGRQIYYEQLEGHARGDGPPLVVLGESGSGKSALLANWALRYRANPSEAGQPEEKSRWKKLTASLRRASTRQSQPLLLMHFIGATPYSTDWEAMLRRIMGEFKRSFGIQQEIPDQADALRAAFANGLHMVAAKGRVVLILDALNQLEDRDGAPDLVWLPPEIPPNIRLIVSTLPGRAMDECKKRGWPTIRIESLTADEREDLISAYLGQYSKQLSASRVGHIASAGQTGNPLYLRALLDELRVFGIHEQVDARIEHYLAAATPEELYEKILGRYEQDYEGDRPGLVRDSMVMLWAARRGLSEGELLEILTSGQTQLPRAYWSPLYLAAESSLVRRSGLIGFGHDYIREAVRSRYMTGEPQQRDAHLKLADYFEEQSPGPRKLEELPWQLAEAKSWQRLYGLLADREFFTAAWDAGQFEVKGYWASIEENSPLRMLEAYASVIDDPATDADHRWTIANLLADTGHPLEALKLREQLAEHFRQAGDLSNLAASLGNQAITLADRGELDEAMRLHKEEERICRRIGDDQGLQRSLGNQALLLRTRGELNEAMRLLKQKEQICRQLGDQRGLQTSLGNQAAILVARGEPDEAMRLLKQAERICRETGNKDGLHAALGDQAAILKEQGQPDDAMRLHKEEEQICRELGNKLALQRTLGNQALIFKERGEADQAMRLLQETERICIELGNKDGLQASLASQAFILYARGELDEALRLHNKQEQLCRELGNRPELQASLGNQAVILKELGRTDEAMRLHKEEERICRELGSKNDLQRSLGNQAAILEQTDDLDEAMRLYKEKEQICRELGNKSGLSASLGGQAYILSVRGQVYEATRLFAEVEQMYHELGDQDLLARSLINHASLLALRIGRPAEALALAEEAYRIANDHDLATLARQIEPILDRVRTEARNR
ncbi:MAG TPA: tetratricopeptide repeat protein [Blastocatellia bacterium]|nr:tetratricopeptide repeat protein [Blastocatellia bacterium]